MKDAAESYVNWWAMSGVDLTFLADPIAYANENAASASVEALAPQPDSVSKQASNAQQPTIPVVAAAPLALPDTLPELLKYLGEHDIVSGAVASPHKILPTGPANAKVMVIADMPDVLDMTAGQLLAGPSGQLFDAMLAAIGLNRADCFLSSLSFTRIPGGRVDMQDANRMVDVQRKLITLAQPEMLLLLGDRTSRALTGMDLQEARGWLRDVNHSNGTISAVTSFHPRFLLQRPQLKRAAWDDLKRLKKGIDDRA